MTYIASNFVAILVAAIAGLLIGASYRPFSVRLQRGFDPVPSERTIGLVVAAACAEFWLAAILAGALILAPSTQAGAWTMAIASAVVIWIGFVVPVLIVSYMVHGLRPVVLLQDGTHWLLVMVVQAAVLHLIGLVHP